MTNYTYEQRKMIAEYLEDSIEVMNCDHDRLVLWQKIKKLKTATFGDIKNHVGTRFKVNINSNVYVVVKDVRTSKILYLDVKNSTIFDDASVSDKYQVEVIDEPTS